MTQKKYHKINRHTEHGSDYPAGKYNFVFSDDLSEWMGAKTTRAQNKVKRDNSVGHRRDFHLKHG